MNIKYVEIRHTLSYNLNFVLYLSHKMIPTFPSFKLMELSDRTEIEKILAQYPPYSDFNFVSLWSYNIAEDLVISLLNNNLVIKIRDYITNDPHYSFLGTHDVEKTIEILVNHALKEGISPVLKFIPEVNLAQNTTIDKSFSVLEDQDSFDYIISLPHLSSLEGHKYKDKRWRVKKFNSLYPDYEIKQLDLHDVNTHKQLFHVFETWRILKSQDEGEVEHELTAFGRLLKSAAQLDVVGVGIYHKNELTGFSVIEHIHDAHAMGHFMKADVRYRWIYEKLYHTIGQHAHKKGASFINIQQDLGFEKLRVAKQSWRPTKHLKKYIITPKD